MALRKDKVQIEVEINGKKATGTYKELRATARNLKRELDGLTPGTDKFVKKAAELKRVNSQLAKIRNQTKGVTKAINESRSQTGLLARAFTSLRGALGVTAIIAGAFAIGRAFLRVGSEALKLFNVQAKADAQIKATLRSTNEAAGRSLQQLKQQAADLQKVTLFGDEQTEQAQALLLTFTNIREEIFDRSVPIVQDYATAIATASGESVNLKDASIQIGKALNDPIKGISALSRAGVQFTDDQKAMIKALQESGDIAGAQSLVLAELEKQFAGSARAAAAAGLGPYTQLGNRIDDLKESFGQLIERGLRRLIPLADRVIGFVEKLAATVLSGKTATGEFAGGINALIFIFKLLSLPIRIATQLLTFLYLDVLQPIGRFIQDNIIPVVQTWMERMHQIIEVARQLPIIGTIIKIIATQFKVFQDALVNTSATFAGLKAAAKTAIEGIKDFLQGMVLSARIAAKKLERALSISSSTKERLSREISELEQLKEQAASSGRSIGEAYTNAREAAIRMAAEKQAAAEAEQERLKAAGLENVRDKLSEEAALREIERQKLKDAKVKAAKAREQLLVPDRLGAPVLGAVSSNGEATADELDQAEALKLERLKNNFLQALTTEQEYEELRLQLQADFAARRLELLQNSGLASAQALLEAENAKLNAEKAVTDQRIENENRLSLFKQKTAEQQRELLDTSLQALTSFFGADEKARKKNASVIKAFETGRILTNAFAEISNIFKNFSAIPFVGQALAIGKAALITARSRAAIKNINAQKFAAGGRTGPGIAAPDETGKRPAGIVHQYEWVAPEWQTRHPTYGPVIDWLESGRVRGFAAGGFTTVDTSPLNLNPSLLNSPSTANQVNEVGSEQTAPDMSRMEGLLEILIEKADRPRPAIVKREDLLTADEEDAFTAQRAGF